MSDLLDDWIADRRPDVTDEHGREPLLATESGRAHFTAQRAGALLAIQKGSLRLDAPVRLLGDVSARPGPNAPVRRTPSPPGP